MDLSSVNSDESFRALIASEEAKRNRNWDPHERFQFIMNTIAWADEQATVRRNTREACLAHQRELLESFARHQNRTQESD